MGLFMPFHAFHHHVRMQTSFSVEDATTKYHLGKKNQALDKTSNLPTPCSWISQPLNCEKQIFVLHKLFNLWYFVEAIQTHTSFFPLLSSIFINPKSTPK
jgi:hypothetical protein